MKNESQTTQSDCGPLPPASDLSNEQLRDIISCMHTEIEDLNAKSKEYSTLYAELVVKERELSLNSRKLR
ncbi:MAG: hypothetical protein HWE30_11545 [Methylocystaceae bacterium]|nr:hypothetical protein [Methylocystaceae bacterium]